jgi:hypothetical protein
MSGISRRVLFQGAGAVGLAAAGWRPATAASRLVTDYRPSQPTGWPPEEGRLRDGVGVTIGGHVASVPFTVGHSRYEVSLVSFGQHGPNPVYEGEPADPTVDFKRTLQKAWGDYYLFRYTGGFRGSRLSVQSYSVVVTRPSAHQVTFGCDLFLVYEPASPDPPITADLRWIQVENAGGRSATEFPQRANPYYFPGGLTSVYGRPACSYYGGGVSGISSKPARAGAGFSSRFLAESFLVLDTRRKDAAGRGIIDVLGGVKWGWQVKPAS